MESHVTKFMVTGKVYNNEEPHANSHLNDDECEEFESDKDVCGPEVFSSHILQAHILKLADSANVRTGTVACAAASIAIK